MSGGNTRRIRGALRPLLKNAPLSKSAVSRIVGTLRGEWEAWRVQSLADLNVVYLYLDAIALRVRSAGKVTGLPVLAAVAVLGDGSKRLVSLEVCGSESGDAWEGFLQALIGRGLKAPRLCIIDGNAGLHRAIALAWRTTKIQRCAVHKLRNILRKVPQHAHDEVAADFHLIVYASGLDAARAARDAFIKKWSKRCSGAVESLNEAGERIADLLRVPQGAVEDDSHDQRDRADQRGIQASREDPRVLPVGGLRGRPAL